MEVGPKSNLVICFGAFELDLDDLTLYRHGIDTRLAKQPAQLLGMLVRRPNQLLSREEIQRALWPGESHGEFDGRLNHAIACIRHALHEDPRNPVYLQTVPKSGYRFIGAVAGETRQEVASPGFEFSGTLSSGASTNPVSQGPTRRPSRLLLRRVAVGSAATIAFVCILLIPAWKSSMSYGIHPTTVRKNVPVRNGPVITAVSPIRAAPAQEIVIDGRGFGHFTPFTSLDMPFLAIADETSHWVAGRIQPANADAVTVTVSAWTDAHIVLEGFSGRYSRDGWKLNPGDKIRVDVWNPQTGAGPAHYYLFVNH